MATLLPGPGVWAMKGSAPIDAQAVQFAASQSGLQAALDYAGLLGQVYVGPGTISGITNLLMYGKCQLSGAGALVTLLVRAPGATGTMLRERSVAEGNVSGAAGIIVKDIGFYGNATGDGIDFGNQGPSTFTSIAYLSDILVRDFTSGTGIKLNANAIHSRDFQVANCATGIWMNGGGANHFSGLWSEQCSNTHLKIDTPWNTFIHVQIEQSGGAPSGPLIDLTANADRNAFCGIYMSLGNDVGNLVTARTGCGATQLYGVRVVTNGHTYTNTVYTEGTAAGTGAIDWIGFFNDMTSSGKHFMYDQSLAEQTVFTGARPSFPQATIGTLNVSGTSALVGPLTAGVAGTGYSAELGQGTTGTDSSTVRARSGSGAGAIAQFILKQNTTDVAGLRYANGLTFLDHGGNLTFRNGIGGTQTAILGTGGAFISAGGLISNTCPTLPDNATPSVQNVTICKCSPAGATTITNFTNGQTGQRITIIFTNANATLSDAGNLKLAGGFVSSADDVMELVYDGTNWYQCAPAAVN